MPLDPFIESKEELDKLPEAIRDYYIPTEPDAEKSGYFLDTDVIRDPRTQPLRNAFENERRKARDLQQAIKKYDGIDIEKWEKLSTIPDEDLTAFETWKKNRQQKDGDDDSNAEFEERLNRVTAQMRETHDKEIEVRDKRLKQLEELMEQLQAERTRDKIDQTFLRLANARQAYDSEDILLRAKEIWRLDEKDGAPAAFDKDGDIIRGKDGVAKLTPEEWIEDLALKKQYLFKESLGGGATGTLPSSNGKFNRVKSKADLRTTEEKVAFITEHGRDAFEDLPLT